MRDFTFYTDNRPRTFDLPGAATEKPRSSFRAAVLALVFGLTLLFTSKARAAEPAAVLERYGATLADPDRRTTSVLIEANLPRLDRQARVQAIRRWAEGKRTYQFLAIEGDSLIRKEIIARYFTLDADAPAITKSNYKFRFVNTKQTGAATVYVFQITPRKKRPGMIAGELWIDAESGLVTHLTGRLVKNPSFLLRRVSISQETEIRAGATQSRETYFHLNTRFAGPVELAIRERMAANEEVSEYVMP